jgi:hypothetical protein
MPRGDSITFNNLMIIRDVLRLGPKNILIIFFGRWVANRIFRFKISKVQFSLIFIISKILHGRVQRLKIFDFNSGMGPFYIARIKLYCWISRSIGNKPFRPSTPANKCVSEK